MEEIGGLVGRSEASTKGIASRADLICYRARQRERVDRIGVEDDQGMTTVAGGD